MIKWLGNSNTCSSVKSKENDMCEQKAENVYSLSIPVGTGLVDSGCRTNNSEQHLEGERNKETGRWIVS